MDLSYHKGFNGSAVTRTVQSLKKWGRRTEHQGPMVDSKLMMATMVNTQQQ